jgi:hypothetical protein
MDESSRKIVKFIAIVTAVVLAAMAARYYAQSQQVKPQSPIIEEKEAPPAPTAEELAAPPVEEEEAEQEVIEEDAEIKMGEPSVNLETGGVPEYAPPAGEATPPAPEPSTGK